MYCITARSTVLLPSLLYSVQYSTVQCTAASWVAVNDPVAGCYVSSHIVTGIILQLPLEIGCTNHRSKVTIQSEWDRYKSGLIQCFSSILKTLAAFIHKAVPMKKKKNY